MPAWKLWERIQRFHKEKREETEAKQRNSRHELWALCKTITRALQSQMDDPPTKDQWQRQKKGKPAPEPQWTEVERFRKGLQGLRAELEKAMSHPYHFEEYTYLAAPSGDGHLFPKPPPEKVLTPQEIREERSRKAREAESRIIESIQKHIEVHGNVSLE